MAKLFKTIGIIGRVKTSQVKESLNSLVDYLLKLNQKIVIEEETAESISQRDLPTISREQLAANCDLVIVIGGDGSLLNAAHATINHGTPILGINRGSLGFLTDIRPNELERVKDILEGKYTLEKRFFITADVTLNNEAIGADDALNEVAIIPDEVPHMIEFEIYIDNQFVCSHNSDGMIIATPTGSTAYALSGGGPILHPKLDAIALVPLSPHTLTSRPIVVEGNSEICIIITPTKRTSPRLSCDGRPCIKIPTGSHITIRKKPKELNLIHPLDYNYFETLRGKLHWGRKLQYSE